MMYRTVDGGYAVFASKAGAPVNPDWYHNLVANPAVRAEIGADDCAADRAGREQMLSARRSGRRTRPISPASLSTRP